MINSIPAGSVDFDSRKHKYSYKGIRLPSVSEILQEVGLSSFYAGIDPFYAARGKAFHSAVQLKLTDDLDYDSIDRKHVLPRFVQWEEWWNSEAPPGQAAFIEKPLGSIYGYAGTPDLVWKGEDGYVYVFDWKTGKYYRHHRLQLGGYGGLVIESGITDIDRVRLSLVYVDGGKEAPKVVPVSPENILTFRACAAVHGWKNRKEDEVWIHNN